MWNPKSGWVKIRYPYNWMTNLPLSPKLYTLIYIISPIPQEILGVINLNQSHITLVTLHLKSPWHPKKSQSNPSKSPFFIHPSPQIPVPHAPPEAAAELCAIWSLPPWLRRRSRCWPGNMGVLTWKYGEIYPTIWGGSIWMNYVQYQSGIPHVTATKYIQNPPYCCFFPQSCELLFNIIVYFSILVNVRRLNWRHLPHVRYIYIYI